MTDGTDDADYCLGLTPIPFDPDQHVLKLVRIRDRKGLLPGDLWSLPADNPVLVEGEMDVLKFHDRGMTAVEMRGYR